MCVSRSSYYEWAAGKSCVGTARQNKLAALIRASFYRHRRRYGTRRIRAELRDAGQKIGRFQIRSLMKREGLRAIAPKRFVPKTTNSNHGSAASPNLLAGKANQPRAAATVIIGDITYLPLSSGQWCYLASWQDKFTRRIVGWAVEERMTDELVIKAFDKALAKNAVNANAIVHTDRGSQFVSTNFRRLLESRKLRQSMSGRGNCYDNAQAESFFSRFKAELVENGLFETVEQARSETFSYIEGYYNRIRKHSSLGYKSPDEFEKSLKIKEKRSSESFVSGKT